MSDNQWYSNKDLFEMFNNLSKELQNLSSEMKETRRIIKQYNGLREKIDEVEEKVNQIEHIQQGKNKFGEAIRLWGGWLFALVTLLILLRNTFM